MNRLSLKKQDYRIFVSPTNEDGKASFFMQFGFSVERWEVLAHALHLHVAGNDVASALSTQFGTKYVVEGKLITPDGRNPQVRSVWIVENLMSVARLITAYPLKGVMK